MIRKFLLGIAILYTMIWCSIAFTVRGKIQNSISNMDKWSVSYSKISVSGFPSRWIFEIIDPSFVSIDQSLSFQTPMITLKVGIRLKDFDLSIARESEIKVTSEEEVEQKTYYAVFEENPHFVMGLKSLVSSSINSIDNLAHMEILPFRMTIRNEDSDIVALLNNSASIKNIGGLAFKISLDTLYEGAEYVLLFSKLKLDTVFDVSFNEKDKKIIPSSLKSEKFDLSVNDDSEMRISGDMNFFDKDKLPEGEFLVDIKNYPKLVDLIWWNSFDLSASDVKNIIAKADKEAGDKDAHLPITFVKEGLKIGVELFSNLTGE